MLLLSTGHAPAQDAPAPDRSTDTDSAAFGSAAARVEFLDRYLTFRSVPLDAHYRVFWSDNSGGRVPGPSDWDLRIVLTLEPDDVPAWIEGMREVAPGKEDLDWVMEFAPGLDAAGLDAARRYEASGKRAALLAPGVLALRYSTMWP